MADFHEATFRWPHSDASDVICTGTFDQWSCSTHLNKTPSGFEAKVHVPWSQKIMYKFVVDGRWTTADGQPSEYDSAGNLNNVYQSPPKPEPPVMPSPGTVEPELTLENGHARRESGSIYEKVTEMAGNAGEAVSNAVAPAMEFADKVVGEPTSPNEANEGEKAAPAETPASAESAVPSETAAPVEPSSLPSPPVEVPGTSEDSELLPKVPIAVVPIMEQAEPSADVASAPPAAPEIPAAPTIPPPEPLETLIVPGAAVDSEKKDEATEQAVQPSTHTGGVADVIEASPAQLTDPAPSTLPAEPAKANGVNGNGTEKTPEASQPSTPAASPSKASKPTSPRDRHFSFPTIKRSSSSSVPRSNSPTPPGSPNGTLKFKTGERKKRNSIFGKIKDVFGNDKEKSGEKQKVGK